ncbi:DUF2075 domain-containing protein [Saccharopolyspora sp. 6T]|uniref:DNA/RNA helicase domain-containing protein n=1 Tax=Saccharopolyspora sp. 6T TaxID=2877238 RepID=UPI001CD6883D|nr:DNA/RNA helicase domain-containing protein [Saccharopolyspora sp. 6T]MCA1185728.1 DUF2075 domain-containing protein [Saccharopolyspora sp. 6T]
MSAPTKTETGANNAPVSGAEVQDVPLAEHAWVKEARRLAKNHALGLIPVGAMAGTWAAGAAAATATMPTDLIPLGAGAVAAAGAYGYAHKRTTGYQRVYAGIAAVASEMFQLGIGAFGGTSWAAATMVLVGSALALPHWVRHSVADPDVTAERELPAPSAALPAPSPEAELVADSEQHEDEEAADERQVLWSENLGKTGPLAGSCLDDLTEFAYGWSGTVTLAIRGHWHSIMNSKKDILSVYDLPDGRVFIEAIPDASVRKARLTVLTSDPLQSVNRWEGPGLNPSTGNAPVMVTADGEKLKWRFWWPGSGATHGLVSGVNGSGKTKVLDLILTEAMASDRVVPYVVDGGEGASLPQWRGKVKEFAENPVDARKLLKYLLRVMDRRREALKRQARSGGAGNLEPSPEMPLILCVIDEAHKLLMSDGETNNKDVKRMCEKLTQEGRKFGICLVLATQVPSATQLGGSTVLRDQLKGGTVIGLRVTERTSGNMVSSGAPMPEFLHELPAEFPNGKATHGLGYMLTARMIRARSLLIDSPDELPEGTAVDVQLDLDSAQEPVPAMDGIPDEPDGEDLDGSAVDAVAHAIEEGCPKRAGDLMRATGLPMPAVKAALKEFK